MFGSPLDPSSVGPTGFGKGSDKNPFEGGIPVGPASRGRLESAPAADFAATARDAANDGQHERAVHLYMLAFDAAKQLHDKPDARTIDYLRRAWESALEMKDRALAEYVFESLEPYCTSEEVAAHVEQLQRLALDKLEEFGFSSESLKEMAQMMAEDFSSPSSLLKMLPGALTHSDAGAQGATRDRSLQGQAQADAAPAEMATYSYKDLVGYGRAIESMRNRGIGLDDDPKFAEFLQMLSRRHGIHKTPSVETLLFRSFAREDASRFMAATVGELGLPAVRMFMEETPQGLPVLCVSAATEIQHRSHPGRGFAGPGVLVLEDIDLWGEPLSSFADEYDEFSVAQLSRGAREAVMFIRSAVENPEVVVLASCADTVHLEDFFVNLLNPIDVVDVPVPDEAERAEVWKHVASMYPSLRYTERGELVRLSANMSREDIYLAAREAVEQAYAESVARRVFVPVTRDNIFDKVAAYQPLDSREYRELEEAAVESLRSELDNLDFDLYDVVGQGIASERTIESEPQDASQNSPENGRAKDDSQRSSDEGN